MLHRLQHTSCRPLPSRCNALTLNRLLGHLKFHHFGVALRRDGDALLFAESLGYVIGERIYDPLQNVYLRLCTAAGRPAIEFVQAGNGAGPLDSILAKYDGLIYHTCYETPHLANTLGAMEEAGLRWINQSEPRPAVLFGGRRVSFYRVVGWGVVELLEMEPAANPQHLGERLSQAES